MLKLAINMAINYLLPVMLLFLVFASWLCFSVCYAGEPTLPIIATGLHSELSTNTEVKTNFERAEISITGGLKSDNGVNLFHSFDHFSVERNYSAVFINSNKDLSPRNIISRVIGGEVSNIYGNLRTDGFDNVNLFLINPAGVVFGSDATLNINGALHVVTTKDIGFFENTELLLSGSDDGGKLTVAQLVDFGFLNEQIPTQRNVETSDNIQILGSTLTQNQGDLSLIGKDINLTHAVIESENGSIAISADRLNMVSSEGKADGIDINVRTMSMIGSLFSTRTTNNQNSGNISIHASDSVRIFGVSDVVSDQNYFSSATINTVPTVTTTLIGEGSKAGDINIMTPNLEITNNAGVFTRALGSTGKAGNITLTANHLIIENSSEVSTIALGEGGGNIDIHSELIVLDDDSKITASALGNGGAITINADFLFNSPRSRISARTAGIDSSIDGIIAVTAPDENVISSTLSLSDAYLNMPVLAANPCASRTDSNGNSLVIRDSSGIAPEPDSMLSANSSVQYDQLPPVSLQAVGDTLVLSDLECNR